MHYYDLSIALGSTLKITVTKEDVLEAFDFKVEKIYFTTMHHCTENSLILLSWISNQVNTISVDVADAGQKIAGFEFKGDEEMTREGNFDYVNNILHLRSNEYLLITYFGNGYKLTWTDSDDYKVEKVISSINSP